MEVKEEGKEWDFWSYNVNKEGQGLLVKSRYKTGLIRLCSFTGAGEMLV